MATFVSLQYRSEERSSRNAARRDPAAPKPFFLDRRAPAGKQADSANHPDWDFARVSIHPLARPAIQTKLAINHPGDQYEQEADRVSDQVMRMPHPGEPATVESLAPQRLQRACA